MTAGRRARVCHLTTVHAATDVRILFKECQSLASEFEVTLIAPGRHGLAGPANVHIASIPIPGARLERLTRSQVRLLRSALVIDADLYHFHDPELMVVAMMLKAQGKIVVYDVHEDFPKIAWMKDYLPAWAKPIIAIGARWLDAAAMRCVDGIVTAAEPVGRRLTGHAPTIVAHNYPMLSEIPYLAGPEYDRRPASALYVGTVSRPRGSDEMIRSAAKVRERRDFILTVAGRCCPAELGSELSAGVHPGFELLGYQSRDQVCGLLSRARIGLVLLHPTPNYVEAEPTKMFEYMAAGLPVIASDFPAWRQIIDHHGCGICVDPQDTDAITAAIDWLLDHAAEARQMGTRGRRAIELEYNWEGEAQKLVSLYRQLLDT